MKTQIDKFLGESYVIERDGYTIIIPLNRDTVFIQKEVVCTCECHEEGSSMMHCFPCCENGLTKEIKRIEIV